MKPPASLLRTLLLALALAAAVAPTPAAAERLATRVEKAMVMDAFNQPGRSFAARCVRVVISTADGRWAQLSSPASPPRACLRAGEVGDGFVIFSRGRIVPTAAWRNRGEGSGEIPCVLPPAVRQDLFGRATCGPF